MSVGLHREGDSGVSQEITDISRAHALCQEEGRSRMPQIMKANLEEARDFEDAVKVADNVAGRFTVWIFCFFVGLMVSFPLIR